MPTSYPAIPNAGTLDRRITVEHKVETTDEYGQPVVTWDAVGDCWAAVQPLRGMERVQAAQLVASFDTRFVVRWRPDVLPLGTVPGTRRIQYEGQSYDVQSVRELGRHEALEVEARASDAPAGALGRRAPGPG